MCYSHRVIWVLRHRCQWFTKQHLERASTGLYECFSMLQHRLETDPRVCRNISFISVYPHFVRCRQLAVKPWQRPDFLALQGGGRNTCEPQMLINKTPSILLSGLSNNSLLSLSCEFLSSTVVSFFAVTHDNCKWAVLSEFFCNHRSS